MNPRPRNAIKVLTVALLPLAGCSSLPPAGSVDDFVARQRAAAEAATENGELAVALAHLRSLATLNPDDESVRAEISSLEKEIDSRAGEAVKRGTAAYKRGDYRAGDTAMLEALALRPGLEEALTSLRASKSRAAHGRQDEKVAAEYAQRTAADAEEEKAEVEDTVAMLEQSLAAGDYEQVLAQARGSETAMRDLARRAHLGLADRAVRDGDRDAELHHLGVAMALADGEDEELRRREEALRDELSDEAYREGLALLQTDLARAIEYFEQAIRYDPNNLAVKQKLDQALRLRDNLKRIRGT